MMHTVLVTMNVENVLEYCWNIAEIVKTPNFLARLIVTEKKHDFMGEPQERHASAGYPFVFFQTAVS